MFSYHGEHGEARMITIVDDFMISEVNGTAATDATIAALKAAFDGEVKVDYSPTSFAGLKLERDRERRTLTLSMPQKIIEAAREHMPELLRGERPTLLSGRRLAVAADSLKLADRDGKLTPQQVRTQSIIGHLKFVERVQPKLCLVLHRLSCVMSAPPPAAYDVARAALNMAYEHRETGSRTAGLALSPSFRGTCRPTSRGSTRTRPPISLPPPTPRGTGTSTSTASSSRALAPLSTTARRRSA